MTPPIRVLYVDDSRFDRELVRDVLEREHGGFAVVEAQAREEFEARLGEGGFDLVLSDFNILGFDGLEVIDAVRARDPHLPVAIVTGTGSEEVAAEALKRGAEDYVIKTAQQIRRLPSTILGILEKRRLSAEREQAERELLAAARRWQITFDAVQEAVAVLDAEGNVVLRNRAMAELLGKAGSGTVGCPCCRAAGGGRRQVSVEDCTVQRARETHCRESEVVELAGRWFSVVVDPILDECGGFAGAVHTMADITVRRQAEAEREQLLAEIGEANERLMQANFASEQIREHQQDLLRAVSHDLRTPLTVILGHAQLLQRTLSTTKQSSPQAAASTAAIVAGALRMNAMLADLSDSASLESGQMRIVKQPLDLGALVWEFLGRAGRAIPVERIQVEVSADLGLIDADPNAVERILTNLLTNAVKYSPPESPIGLRVVRADHQVTVSVIDHGSGIAAEELPRLFQRFYRVKGTTSIDGLGLGLYISRLLVEAHDGRIWAESDMGKGSRFSFSLPAITRTPNRSR
ncbi:MAG: response regulator [Chloroflexi bacterium]|nr:response regulator [Chloroflexota bacterium]